MTRASSLTPYFLANSSPSASSLDVWTADSIATGQASVCLGMWVCMAMVCASLGFFFLLQGALTVWTLYKELERKVSGLGGDHGWRLLLAPHFPKNKWAYQSRSF